MQNDAVEIRQDLLSRRAVERQRFHSGDAAKPRRVDSAMIEKVEYPNFHTFAEGVQYLAQGNFIDYEVKIGRHTGALMTREEWLQAVESHSFIDYDGMGNEVDENGNILGVVPPTKVGNLVTANGDPGWIKPSQAGRIRPDT